MDRIDSKFMQPSETLGLLANIFLILDFRLAVCGEIECFMMRVGGSVYFFHLIGNIVSDQMKRGNAEGPALCR
ncbi:hypothetical protein [Sinanaerobacter chloroacetimidivorans]|uniref:Uncharacterized protein n=1 Tax=Sinanaerobacter chloroacetimidivorans TaxID=2818044 RepID=A0A8J7W3R0_9FIRM|nr:hypothetical protein [Sinanaerobacter chloroacetimidivorans]MBR0598813.1 hypothetical protein [Sinanaerobacter chloroacetimidivorans]